MRTIRPVPAPSLPKRFPDRDEIAAVRAEAEAVEPDGEAEETRGWPAG